MRRYRLAAALLVAGCVAAAGVGVVAQTPYNAQIQLALRQFIAQANTWTGTQTFTNLTVSGSCTGCSGGSGDLTATYWLKTSAPDLPNAIAMGGLATGLVVNHATTGTPTIYTGTSCSSQFVRSLSASAAATCSAVALGADVSGTLGVANGGTGIASYTKGDLIAASATTTLGNLAVGTNGQVLVADSTQTLGVKWATISGTGTVTNTGTLTASRLMLGNGGSDITALGSLGTTTTVLHGNAAGNPSFGAVVLTTDVSGVLPTANGGTSSAYFAATGMTAARTFTFPDASATVLTTNARVATTQGGTGIDSSGVTDGQLLIGQSSDHTFGLAALTAGTNITITNAGHGITISSTASSCAPTYTAKTTTYTAVACDFVVATSGTFTVTLPAASSNLNKQIWVTNAGSGTITIGRSGSDTVGNQAETSYTLNPGDAFVWTSDGVSAWYIQ